MSSVRTLPRRILAGFLALGFLAVLGCGGGGGKAVNLKGKVVMPANMKLLDTDEVQITFTPEGSAGKAATATAKAPSLTFEPTGATMKKGMAPGKYKVGVSVTPYMGAPESQGRAQFFEDTINKAYSPGSTNMTYEVTSDLDQSITIDLTKGTVTKG